jgi:hypothetical protein
MSIIRINWVSIQVRIMRMLVGERLIRIDIKRIGNGKDI